MILKFTFVFTSFALILNLKEEIESPKYPSQLSHLLLNNLGTQTLDIFLTNRFYGVWLLKFQRNIELIS